MSTQGRAATSQSSSASNFEAYHLANPVYAYAPPQRDLRIDAFEMVLDDRAGWGRIRERAFYRRVNVRYVRDSVKQQIERALRLPYITSHTVF